MNQDGRTLSTDAQDRLDEYLDAVDRVLADTGVSRSERRSICDEVEAQACEMAWQRATGEPSAVDMDAVLAEMDAPQAYGDAGPASAPRGATQGLDAGRKVHPFALWALLLPATAVLLVSTLLCPRGEVPTFVCFGVIALASVLFSVLAVRDIRREPGRYSGTGLALAGALALPLDRAHGHRAQRPGG